MMKALFAKIANLFRRLRFGNQTESIASQPEAQAKADEPIFDVEAFQRSLDRHRADVPHLVHTAFSQEPSDDQTAKITAIANEVVESFSQRFGNRIQQWYGALNNAVDRIRPDFEHWSNPANIANRFLTEVEKHEGVLLGGLKAVYENKVRGDLRANQIRNERAQLKRDRRNLLIRLLGDENGHLKMVNFRVYYVLNVLFFGVLIFLESVIGMPIFRFESSSIFGYLLAVAFALLVGGFIAVGSSNLKKYLANRHAWQTYRHVYGDQEPTESIGTGKKGRVIKPTLVSAIVKILAFGCLSIVFTFGFVLLAWRTYVSALMDNDGGMGFINALLLFGVMILMFVVDMSFGPQFARSDYDTVGNLEDKDKALETELRTLATENDVTTRVQQVIRHYDGEIALSEQQIRAEAEWLPGELNQILESVENLVDEYNKAPDYLWENFEVVHQILCGNDYRFDSAEVNRILDDARWGEQLKQHLEQIEKPKHIQKDIERFENFKPVYELPKNTVVVNFKDLRDRAEKESRDKVMAQHDAETRATQPAALKRTAI